jgi:hypothetical protein
LTSISETLLLDGDEAVRLAGSADVDGVVVTEGGFGSCTAVEETGLTAMISWEMVSDFVVTSGRPKNCPANQSRYQYQIHTFLSGSRPRTHQLQPYSSPSQTNLHIPHPLSTPVRSLPKFPWPGTNPERDRHGIAVLGSSAPPMRSGAWMAGLRGR